MSPTIPILRSNSTFSEHNHCFVTQKFSCNQYIQLVKEVKESKFPFKLKPNCLVYMNYHNKNYFNPFYIDFIVKFKKEWKDPFVNKPSDNGSFGPFLSLKGYIYEVLGQLTMYATTILSSQYYMHTFMVFIFKDISRLSCAVALTEVGGGAMGL
jgi:hypothetical protein